MSEPPPRWPVSGREAHRQAQIRRLQRASDALVTARALVQAADAELRAALAACSEADALADEDDRDE